MGLFTCMSSSNSKVSSSSKITDSSTSHPLPGQHNSIRTFRELRAQAMSSPTWRRTETTSIMEFSRSMADLLEEVANQLMMLMPRQSIQGSKLRPSIY
uniref:AC4 n=1 Tax=Tomato leaf curl Gujarat virus TaxID=219299 RepID=A0A2S1ZWE5_9GEMI|nr:AC4 [Tomato leaf curl Gujarat virus]